MSAHKLKIIKDIADRTAIVDRYYRTHTVDRDYIIKLIQDKKMEDPQILFSSAQVQAVIGSTPYEKVTDENLIKEVELQIAILQDELKS